MDENIEEFNNLLYQYIEESKQDEDTSNTEEKLIALLLLFYAMFYSDQLSQITDELGIELTTEDKEDVNKFIETFRETLTGLKERVQDNYDPEETLEESVEKDKWQGQRISNTDIWIIAWLASVSLMKSYKSQFNNSVLKKWVARNDNKTCEICKSMDGTVVDVEEPFIADGEIISLNNGETYIHDYYDSDVAYVHPHDRCKIIYIISIDGNERTIDFNLTAH